jgi:hypothetical protein
MADFDEIDHEDLNGWTHLHTGIHHYLKAFEYL